MKNYITDLITEFNKINHYWWIVTGVWLFFIIVSVKRTISFSPIASDISLTVIILLSVIRWTIVTAFIFIIYKIADVLNCYKYRWLYHSILLPIFVIIITLLFTLAGHIYLGMDILVPDFIKSTLYNLEGLIIIVPLLYSLTLGYYYYENSFDEYTLEKIKNENLKKSLIEAKLAVFRSQLDPHFLFNTLQAINTLIEVNQEKAKKTLAYLSKILGLIEKRINQEKVELKKEMKLVNYYLKIEKIRYQDLLNFNVDIRKNSLDALVPTYSIQLLVENAIKHGISKQSKNGLVRIKTQIEGDNLLVEVENSDKNFSLDSLKNKEGIGISNIISRLQKMYDSADFSTMVSEDLGGLKVTFIIPFETKQPYYGTT